VAVGAAMRSLRLPPVQQVVEKRRALKRVAAAQKGSKAGFRHGDWRRALKDARTVLDLAKEEQ